MKYTAALAFYKSAKAIAATLGLTPQAVYKWQKDDLIPLKRARVLHTDSKKVLDMDYPDYEK